MSKKRKVWISSEVLTAMEGDIKMTRPIESLGSSQDISLIFEKSEQCT